MGAKMKSKKKKIGKGVNVENNFLDFIKKNKGVVFRYWVYRRGFTPYEQENKFSDESMFEDIECTNAFIEECIYLPDGDVLIGFLEYDEGIDWDDGQTHYRSINYEKLSNIKLACYKGDQEGICDACWQ